MFRLASLVVCTMTAVVLAVFFFIFLFSQNKTSDSLESFDKANETLEPSSNSSSFYEVIGSGPLSLNASQFSSFTPNLSREIVVIARNTRPDARSEEICLMLSLKSCKQEQVVLNGQQVFLEFDEKAGPPGDSLKFSPDKTSLWVRPLVLDKNSVLIEVVKEVHSDGMESSYEEKTQFVLQVASRMREKAPNPVEELYAQTLRQGKCWGADMLLQRYGGEEYKELMDRHKVELGDGTSTYLCFLAQGDFLTWEEDHWRPCSLEEMSHNAPAAYVKNLSDKEMEIEVWDESGFYSLNVKLEPMRIPKLVCRPDSLPSSIRLRTTSQINCVLGKRRLILRKGDWLMRNASGWRILKKFQEIEDCLQHKLKGELLIFDGIEKEMGQILLKGHVFDEMRTQIQSISIPIIAEKKSSRHNKIQRRPLRKRWTSPSSNTPGKIGEHQLAFEPIQKLSSSSQTEEKCL
jgi:hypothetical protein